MTGTKGISYCLDKLILGNVWIAMTPSTGTRINEH